MANRNKAMYFCGYKVYIKAGGKTPVFLLAGNCF